MARDRQPRRSRTSPWRTGLGLGVLGFAMAVGIGLPSEALVEHLSVWFAIPLVLFIIGIAVVLDMLGVAATAADPVPFHAKASKREPGAQQALYLIQRADRVASIAMDIVGDVTAAVAGAAVIAIIDGLLAVSQVHLSPTLLNALGLGVMSFMFIGMKGLEKGWSIRNANRIIGTAGLVLEDLRRLVRLDFSPRPSPGDAKSNGHPRKTNGNGGKRDRRENGTRSRKRG